MRIHDYIAGTRQSAIYPGVSESGITELFYLGMGLADEAAEVAEKVEACVGQGVNVLRRAEEILPECGDVAWFMARLVDALDFEPSKAAGIGADGSVSALSAKGQMVAASVQMAVQATPAVLLSLRLCARAGKVAGKIRKLLRDAHDDEARAATMRADLQPLLAEAFECWAGLVVVLGGQPQKVLQANLDKLASRLERGVLLGSGDSR